MLTALLFDVAAKLVPRLPISLSYGVAWLVGEGAYRLARSRRAAAAENMRRVLGLDCNAPRLQQTVRAAFHTQARNYVDMFLIPHIQPAHLSERVETENMPALLRAHRQGKGVVVATAHLGNFDLLMQIAREHDLPLAVLAERLRPEQLFNTVARIRGAHGVRVLPASTGGLREALRHLRAGGVVALVADRQPRGAGVGGARLRLPFFGEATWMPSGAAGLALRTGAALVPAFGLRLPRRRYRICIEPPLEAGSTFSRSSRSEQQPGAGTPEALAAALISVMERYIRDHPDQWVVFEPLWGEETGRKEAWKDPAERTSTLTPA